MIGSRIWKEIHEGQTILVLDYSNLKEAEMMELLEVSKDLLVSENVPRLILVIFSERGYVTPAFMRKAEKFNKKFGHLIQNQAFIGLSEVKKFILKGFNLFLGKNFQAFDSKEEAINCLLEKMR